MLGEDDVNSLNWVRKCCAKAKTRPLDVSATSDVIADQIIALMKKAEKHHIDIGNAVRDRLEALR